MHGHGQIKGMHYRQTIGKTFTKRPNAQQEQGRAGLSLREGNKGVRNANRNEPAWRRSLLHGQDMGKTQYHRSIIEQWLAVGGWWWLAVCGRRLAVGGWWLVVVSGWRLAVAGG